MGVPKVIHYCWFGGDPIDVQANRTLESWRKFAPGYEIRRWDERNFDIGECSFVRGAYSAGKWAFVSDYARFKILYEFGGVYMDVGSELKKEINDLIDEHAPLAGMERGNFTVNTGLIAACEAGDTLFEEMLRKYKALKFENTDVFCATHTVNKMLTSVLIKYGYKQNGEYQRVHGWTLLPPEYFDPSYGFGGYATNENTYSVHRHSGSWCPPAIRREIRIVQKIAPYIGMHPARIIGRMVGEISCNGVRGGFSNILSAASKALGKSDFARVSREVVERFAAGGEDCAKGDDGGRAKGHWDSGAIWGTGANERRLPSFSNDPDAGTEHDKISQS